ncbi:MAG: hypothetical protein AAF962_14185 [Actinomycetota bacterium]
MSIGEEAGAGRGALVVRPDTQVGEGAIFLIHGGGYVVGSNREALDNGATSPDLATRTGPPPGHRLGTLRRDRASGPGSRGGAAGSGERPR